MKNIEITTTIINLHATPGSVFSDCVKDAYDFAVKWNVEVELIHNSRTIRINKYTDINKIN